MVVNIRIHSSVTEMVYLDDSLATKCELQYIKLAISMVYRYSRIQRRRSTFSLKTNVITIITVINLNGKEKVRI